MLSKLTLNGVGPAKSLEVEFSERLNLITGDNGVGKSFLLDLAWWVLAGRWPRSNGQAVPRDDAPDADTYVSGTIDGAVKPFWAFDFPSGEWRNVGDEDIENLVIYAQVDGGFSVYDPARRSGDERIPKLSNYLFSAQQVWAGIEENGKWRCNGLYRDWASWQREKNHAFWQLKRALEALSPPGETLRPGALLRISTEDVQDYPTIHMPYGIDVPVIHASAAIRRILALAYLLIWTWQEHLQAAALRRQEPARELVLIIDEIEAHLHPAWQKRILPSILTVMEKLTAPTRLPSVQVIASTHSPLVCVSLEDFFDPEKDRLLDLDLDPENGVKLESVPFTKRGTGEKWLLSRHFDLKSTYSEPAEKALAAAAALVGREITEPGSVNKDEFLKQDRELRNTLSDIDSYWVTWPRIGERRGWLL